MYYPYYVNACPYCLQPVSYTAQQQYHHHDHHRPEHSMKDQGPKPYVVNIEDATKQNHTFRTALWTGKHLQMTLMSIPPGEDIGLEMHSRTDQFIQIEEGRGLVEMGKEKHKLDFRQYVGDDSAIFIPAGTWHNLKNIGSRPLKLFSIYAPPQHPFGTMHRTKADANKRER